MRSAIVSVVISGCLFAISIGESRAMNPPVPPVHGAPRIDRPNLLSWPPDRQALAPDLSEVTANGVHDLHASFAECDLVLSTAGNIHMALRELWFDVFLPGAADLDLKNWMYTTSPPISPQQVANKHVGLGNFRSQCVPQVAVGPAATMNQLRGIDPAGTDLTDGTPPVAIARNRGNVILVKKGNPKNIQTIWDLGRNDVRVVTPNPETEPGSFGNYRDSIFLIAHHNPQGMPPNATPEALFNRIFNNHLEPNPVNGKWLAGARIHHRELPWSIAFGHADAGLIFYHLARYMVATFPDRFDIVPLGGTAREPLPLQGNRVATLFAVRIGAAQALGGAWTTKQDAAAGRLLTALRSLQFKTILEGHGLQQPAP